MIINESTSKHLICELILLLLLKIVVKQFIYILNKIIVIIKVKKVKDDYDQDIKNRALPEDDFIGLINTIIIFIIVVVVVFIIKLVMFIIIIIIKYLQIDLKREREREKRNKK